MRSISVLMVLSGVSIAGEPDAARLRAKAALALAFAPPTYAEQYAKAIQEKKPLVVFVRQQAKLVGSCLCVACDSFADVTTKGVVIGLPDGAGLRRVDLPGEPTAETIQTTIAEAKPDRRSAQLPIR
ncbi:MAG: hypothetical protein JNK93_10645 [Planctomycetia bacterium]|nr:hypothetical protein [Planctomycetia bacterium]